jgi:hypothetical protein
MTERMDFSTRDRIGAYDAIETAKPGEPLFPIQGGDPLGPPTVQFWADMARKAAMKEVDEEKAAALLKKATSAETVAWTMLAYQRGELKVDGARARYNDDDHAVEKVSERRKLIEAAAQIRNAVANINDVAELLASLKHLPMVEVALREATADLNNYALGIEPRRGNERS